MTTMSDLPKDLVGEILCKVPMTSLGRVRSTCKTWDALSKSQSFGKAAARKQFLGFMMMDFRVCSLRFDLQGIRNGDLVDPSIKRVAILDQVQVCKVFHCDGLLLCVTNDSSRLLVWNPYLEQTRWIQPRDNFHILDRYALGYDSNRDHKILRVLDDYILEDGSFFAYEMYDFSSNSWRVLDVTPDWEIECYQRGVSLKGNAYFFAKEKLMGEGVVGADEVDTTETADFLLCFDFTSERFGPRLSLPFHSYFEDTVTLSCVREEQLAVLYQHVLLNTCTVEIWVTTRIEPSAVSWSKFLKLGMRPLAGVVFTPNAGSFFIDEEKKLVVVFGLDEHRRTNPIRYQTAHILGQDGYSKSVNIGEAPYIGTPHMSDYCQPLVCSSSYVPSLVQLRDTIQTGKRNEREF